MDIMEKISKFQEQDCELHKNRVRQKPPAWQLKGLSVAKLWPKMKI